MNETDDPSRKGGILKASGAGTEQIRLGLDVVSIDGEPIGTVKSVRAGEFPIDRPMARDLWVPFDSVVEAAEHGGAFRHGPTQASEVVLIVSADDIDHQGWRHS
jgi:hypothetical protein